MRNSIQYFTENGIPELEKIKLNFLENPAMFDKCVDKVCKVFLQTACCLICGWLEEYNTFLESSLKRRLYWQVKDRGQKNILTTPEIAFHGSQALSPSSSVHLATKKRNTMSKKFLFWRCCKACQYMDSQVL